MRDYIYDIESYANVFTLAAKHIKSGKRWLFEISHRKNDIHLLIDWIRLLQSVGGRMVGFNNIGFDYPVLHYILHNEPNAEQINSLVQFIINKPHDDRFSHIIWDRDQIIPQIDLYKIHHFDNVARATSLKVLEFNMRAESVQDLPFAPGSTLTDEQIDTLIQYNQHDVDMTEVFYHHTADALAFREILTQKYGRNFLNDNDTKIGKQYFIMLLGPDACYGPDRKPRQTYRPSMALAEVIFPWIHFARPEFEQMKNWFASQVITETKGVFEKLSCMVDGFQFDFGTGGIHGSVSSRTVSSDVDYMLLDLDVSSYYPNLGIVNRLYPHHLSESFCDIYSDVYEQRKSHAKGTPENAMLKLALNGVYGDSNNQYSPFYDPLYTMSITINGQLLLCLLAEYLMDIPELEMIQINTDGLTVRIPRTAQPAVQRAADWWECLTGLQLEQAEYQTMWIRDVNNYSALYQSGKVKRKGAYEYVLGWHQNHSALIIPRAAEAALLHGADIREFITSWPDIMDFMLRAKVPRNSRLVLAEQPVQNVTRYYVAIEGGPLVKIMPPLSKKPGVERRIGIAVGWLCAECNDMQSAKRNNINYEYYIKETEKLVNPLR